MSAPDAVDEAGSHIDARQAVRDGITVIAEYIGWQSWKSIGSARVREIHAAGAGFFPLYEDSATNALGGSAQGAIDGQRAATLMAALVRGVGYAPAAPVADCFAVDFDVQTWQLPTVDAYMRAAAARTPGPDVAYGKAALLDHLAAVGIAQWGFGTYAWSYGAVSRHAALQQYANGHVLDGAQVDFDHVLNAAALQAWWPPGVRPSGSVTAIAVPAKPVPPVQEEDDMKFTLVQVPQGHPSAGQVWATCPGTIPFWVTPSALRALIRFGWITNDLQGGAPVYRVALINELQDLEYAARCASLAPDIAGVLAELAQAKTDLDTLKAQFAALTSTKGI